MQHFSLSQFLKEWFFYSILIVGFMFFVSYFVQSVNNHMLLEDEIRAEKRARFYEKEQQ